MTTIPPEVLAESKALRLEREAIITRSAAILERYEHRDRMPRYAAHRFDYYVRRLGKVNERLGVLGGAWGDTPPTRRFQPRWESLGRAVDLISRRTSLHPANVAAADRTGAVIRDRLHGLGLSIEDPETLYVLLVGVGMVVELTEANQAGPNPITPETVAAVALVAQSITAATIPHLPEEARP